MDDGLVVRLNVAVAERQEVERGYGTKTERSRGRKAGGKEGCYRKTEMVMRRGKTDWRYRLQESLEERQEGEGWLENGRKDGGKPMVRWKLEEGQKG